MQGKPVAEQEIGRQLLLETVAYTESAVCRPKLLLNYFGEILEEPCNNCDNCLNPKPQFNAKDSLLKLLSIVKQLKEQYKADHIINILTGNENAAVKSYKHSDLDIFGSGDEKDDKYWNAVIRQALVHHFLLKEIENYGLLKISKKGRKFLQNPYDLMFSEDHDYQEDNDTFVQSGTGTGSADPQLFALLKKLRKKISHDKQIPPFVIFQDASLEDMSIQYPVSIDELKSIVGVGAGKASRYGAEFVKLIRQYVDDNEIERPTDMVVKSVVNKSGLKVYIIQSIDRRISLDDIADAKGLELNQLIDEIEAIVNSGTKINIDYYINETMDEEHQIEVYDYFREAATESIKDALIELGEDEYTEEDIRLMRIKFMSEMGN